MVASKSDQSVKSDLVDLVDFHDFGRFGRFWSIWADFGRFELISVDSSSIWSIWARSELAHSANQSISAKIDYFDGQNPTFQSIHSVQFHQNDRRGGSTDICIHKYDTDQHEHKHQNFESNR